MLTNNTKYHIAFQVLFDNFLRVFLFAFFQWLDYTTIKENIPMKYIFIINPEAGKEKSKVKLDNEIRSVFKDTDFIVEYTKYPGHATEIAMMHASTKEEMIIFACGGDGTINEVVNGMYKYKNAKLALIPIGTGNDFIKFFKKISKDDFLNLEGYKDGQDLPCDLIYSNNRVCLNIASVGFDARVVQKVARFKRLPFVNGGFAYILSVFNSFLASMKFHQALKIDDTYIDYKNYIFIVAANGSYYGGGFHPTPDAKINDGFIDVITIDALSRLRVMTLIKKYKAGEHRSFDFVKEFRCKKLQILGKKEVVLNMDGETIKVKDPIIEILEKQITLYLPKKNETAA